jgi:nicotinamidase-related amidase
MIDGSLIAADDSILIVVDAQPGFIAKLEPAAAEELTGRIAWLVQVASQLDVPIVATEEEPDRHGATAAPIRETLPAGVIPMRKEVFGLADQDDILAAVLATSRRTAILVGLETDVCVAHSASGLLARGYRVVVVADATASPGDSHAAGLERIRYAGALVTTTKGLYYEWVRTVARAVGIAAAVPPPTGLSL